MLYHECLGYDCAWFCYWPARTAYPELDWGAFLGCCSLRWSRDEAARYFYCLVLFRSVQPRFLLIVAEDNCGSGLGELTFLQLSTTYVPVIAGRSVGYVLQANQLHT